METETYLLNPNIERKMGDFLKYAGEVESAKTGEIIFDAFISVYDTLCFDRKKFRSNSIIGKFLKWYDSYLCNISDIVLVDTKTHKKYFEKEFNDLVKLNLEGPGKITMFFAGGKIYKK